MMKKIQASIRYGRTIPVRDEVDLFVAGGGPSGVAAAVSAARSGLKVFLAEAQGAFGGMGTLGLVPSLLGYSDGLRTIACGIGVEVVQRLVRVGGTSATNINYDNFRAVTCDAESLKRVYDDMMQEAGVRFSFFTSLVDVRRKGRRVTAAILSAKSGLCAVKARMFIDATGDGDLCALAGTPYEKGDAEGLCMPGTLCSQWVGVDWPAFQAGGVCVQDQLRKAIADGVFTQHDLHLPGIVATGAMTGVGNIGHLYGIDNTDECSVTPHMLWGRKMALEYLRFYRDYVPGFRNMALMQTAPLPGIRETRRILGDYVLTREDFLKRASFPDEIGRFSYPVDIHPSRPDPKAYAQFEEEFRRTFRYAPGESYGIPYRALLPRRLDNVFVAGRCISADRHLQASIRVMAGCFLTGMATGVAAGLAQQGDGDTRAVDTEVLRGELRRRGAWLPG